MGYRKRKQEIPYEKYKGAIASYRIPVSRDSDECLILEKTEIENAKVFVIHERKVKLYTSFETIPEGIKKIRKVREIPEEVERIEIKGYPYYSGVMYNITFY